MGNKKKSKRKSLLFLVVTILALMMPQTVLATGGTDGTELNVAEPSALEIQLGAEWSGVEFELKTDAGMYPGTIPVGTDGVLRLEIGGSKSYVLTCMQSKVAAPEPQEETEQEESSSTVEKTETNEKENTVAGIPVMHLVLFAGGLVISVGILVGLYIVKRRKLSDQQYQDDDEDDD